MVLAQDLRNAVLQAALQGKLTKQLEKDSSVDEMLKAILEDKNARIEKKEIKRDKLLFPENKTEVPFAIPPAWKWITLGSLVYKLTDGTHKTPKYTESGVKFVSVKDMSTGRLFLDNTKYISQKKHEELYERCDPEKGDILLSKVGTTGVPAIVDTDEQFSLFVSVALLKFNHKYINPNFFYYMIYSPLVQQQAIKNTKGIGNKNWVLDKIANTLVVLPPIEEQQRIVDRVDDLMEKIDDYEKVEKELVDLENKFSNDMKNAFLHAAMQGKLTERLENDSSVEEMLNATKEEKKQLIKEQKIRKEKILPPIERNEIPFEIPENWKWVRLRDIVYNRGQKKPDKCFSYIDIGSIDNIHQKLNDGENIIEASEAPSRARKIVNYGDVLYATVRPYLHNMCIVDKKFEKEPIASTGFAVMTCCIGVVNKFLLYYMLSPEFDNYVNSTENAKGVAYPAINDDRFYRALVPVPSFEEQERIVERLEQLIPLCETL